MSGSTDQSPYASTNTKMLHFVVESARSCLRDQLQCALAADQRALVLAGFAISAAIVLAGGLMAMAQQGLAPAFGLGGVVVVLLLLGSAGLAIWSARPARFHFAGDEPNLWQDDLARGGALADSLAELANHLDERIAKNDALLAGNARLLMRALWLALGAAGLAAGVYAAMLAMAA